MRDDQEYVDPTEELEEKLDAIGHHVGEHCHFFEESFDRIEKLEKDAQKINLLTPLIIVIIFFSFMTGYISRSVSTVDERIDRLGRMEVKDIK